MIVPFWAMLVPYGAYCALFVAFAWIDVRHMVRFGTFGFVNFLVLAAFLAGTAIILWATAQLLAGFDWSAPITNLSRLAPAFSATPL